MNYELNKGFIISFGFLVLSAILLLLIFINRIFFTIPWIDFIYNLIIPLISSFFNSYSLYIHGVILMGYMMLLPLFVLGYNLAKTKQLTGSIMYVLSLLGFVILTLIVTYFTYFGLLFNKDLTLNTRLMFCLLLLPIDFIFSLVLFLFTIDLYIFLIDLLKARKIWNHNRPDFKVETKGNMTYIHIDTEDHLFTPIPMLIIAKYLQSKRFSIAWFVKGAFNHLLSLIISYLTGWPRARNVLFKFIGMKIGSNCHISERSIPDPLLPELIEFEDGSGCGIGVKFLTHNAMNIEHSTFSFGPIKIGKNARIGAYSLILPGVTIGRGSIIGANSVVADDVPPFCIAHGSPAKIVRQLTDDEKKAVDKDFTTNNNPKIS